MIIGACDHHDDHHDHAGRAGAEASHYDTPNSRSKILVFSDPTLGKYYATTYEKNGFWATQPLSKILVREILLCEPGVLCVCYILYWIMLYYVIVCYICYMISYHRCVLYQIIRIILYDMRALLFYLSLSKEYREYRITFGRFMPTVCLVLHDDKSSRDVCLFVGTCVFMLVVYI